MLDNQGDEGTSGDGVGDEEGGFKGILIKCINLYLYLQVYKKDIDI